MSTTLDHLPAERSSFIERAGDVEGLTRQLNLSAPHLVTLTGPYGVGKSRLALRIASQLSAEFSAGVWWVDLTGVIDPTTVPQAVADTLQRAEQPEQTVLSTLQDSLYASHLLLVLDGCDHIIDACGDLVYALLDTCPNVYILATSREALGIEGETIWPVAPLPTAALELPTPFDATSLPLLLQISGIRLFVERAQMAQPSFKLTTETARSVVEICYHLDGIPLALELAARRVRVMSVQQMATWMHDILGLLKGVRLKSLSPHLSLRAALDWSYDQLSPQDRQIFCCLAVFEEAATFEALRAMLGDEIPTTSILDILSRLVDKSLITVLEHRAGGVYQMLEVWRQYCQAKLDESGEADTVHRYHVAYYATLAERADTELQGPEQMMWLERLEQEHDNLRAALTWATQHGDEAMLLRLNGNLWRFWEMRGHITEGRQWLDETLIRVESAPSPAYAKVLHGAAVMANNQSDLPCAKALYEACLLLQRQLGDSQGIATALQSLDMIAKDEGNHQRAASLYQASAITVADPLAEPALRIYGLGRADVYRNDILLTTGEWKYAKPKEMLFFLLSREARTKEQVGVMLWPEASASQLRATFHPTLHYLRRALGELDWVIQSNKAYVFNRTRPYWYDAEAFEQYLADARRLQSEQPEAAIRHLQGAVELYKGNFLEGFLDSEWVTLRREELQREYIEVMLLLGLLFFDQHDYSLAADIYHQLLARDNYQEAAHRGLMNCYDRLGERVQATLHYQHLVEVFKRELGISPSPETTALFERLSQDEAISILH